MRNLITRGARLGTAAALLAASSFAAAQATDWNKLQSNSWNQSGDAAGQATTGASGDSAGQATMGEAAAGAGGTDWSAEIATAFQGLGMEPARAECYGNILTNQLPPEAQEEAAQLVSAATSGDEVRMAVMDSGPTMVGGFSAADASCPEGMGG